MILVLVELEVVVGARVLVVEVGEANLEKNDVSRRDIFKKTKLSSGGRGRRINGSRGRLSSIAATGAATLA